MSSWYNASMSIEEGSAGRLRDCPGFARFWTASTVSGFGTYITTLAIQVLIVLTLHAGAAGVGLVNAARWLPYLLFGLVAGVLVDRSRRRPVLVTTDIGRGLLLIAIPALALTHRLSIPVLMVFMAVFGLLSLLNDAASQSFLPRLVPAHLLTEANARLDQSDAVAQTSGPALAGGLVSLLTAPWAVLVDAASYLISGVLLARVNVAEPPPNPATDRNIRREAAEGLRWIYAHPILAPAGVEHPRLVSVLRRRRHGPDTIRLARRWSQPVRAGSRSGRRRCRWAVRAAWPRPVWGHDSAAVGLSSPAAHSPQHRGP